MLSKIISCGICGIDGYRVDVEVDLSLGLPAFEIVGLADIAVRESRERVRAAIKNSGFEFPLRKITVNLAPASIKKEGSIYDLAIALAILSAGENKIPLPIDSIAFTGELALDGRIKPVKGILSMAMNIKQEGIRTFVVPEENGNEAAIVEGLEVIRVGNLEQVIAYLNGSVRIEPYKVDLSKILCTSENDLPDFSEVRGQANAKRALEVAASGGHNVLLTGSPGAGKTMLARRMPGILPHMSFEEALEVTKIHSISGLLKPGATLISERPFRSPHHSITSTSLAGGGRNPKPGEISLSHNGVLFLDELPEFSRDALEVLRQPLEDGVVNISRLNGSFEYPARASLICSSNPCKCGYLLDKQRRCRCTPIQVQNYLSRLSGPLLDRIDIQIEVPSVKYEELQGGTREESSDEIRKRVNLCRKIQIDRYKGLGIFSNAQLSGDLIERFCVLDKESKSMLKIVFEKLGLSARAYSRILKVARTIADMDQSEEIKLIHTSEAVQYRSLDRRKSE